jgi:hypothetical protein
MGNRTALGLADVTDSQLAGIIAGWAGLCPEDVTLVDSSASVVPYDLEAITTAGRYWVSGTALTPRGSLPFRFFVKHVQSWSRSPLFEAVPPPFREAAAASVPWRTEPLVYRSDLATRLPTGFSMPTAVAVHDVDDLSCALWLEEVPVTNGAWTTQDLEHAAYLLGRLAASPRVRPLASVGEQDRRRSARDYADGRLAIQVVPMLRDDDLWGHPMLAGTFDEGLRDRMLAEAGHVDQYVLEIESVPLGTAHGDACTNNLLRTADSTDIVLIDYGFWSTQPFGFDLGQLLLGDEQLGRRRADSLVEVEDACLPAYVRGLRDEGAVVDEAVVQRAHALQMLLYSGLSAAPFELLAQPPSPEMPAKVRERAAMARFVLDLVDRTEPVPSTPAGTPASRTGD